jgi:3'(2'), 5'-bisphosphate nucleotidase
MMPTPKLETLAAIAEDAGRAIMTVRGGGYTVEFKSDHSPLTQADLAAHKTIMQGLTRHFPGVPVLSEEGAALDYEARACLTRLFIVDPLDGTKEFVKELGEFCVCIALAENGFPAYGAVHAPVWGKTFVGGLGLGAFRREGGQGWQKIKVRQPDAAGLIVLASRSHPDPVLEAYLADKPIRERITAGSALKFCLVAEGRADLYPRFNPTREWDTAAGQAVLEGAGGSVVRFVDANAGQRLPVNKADLFNGPFLASANPLG